MKTRYKGSCLCGKVHFEIEGVFESFYLCHCRYCRKDTGSAHASNLFSSSARLHWLSGEEGVSTFALPSTQHARSFCSHCGSALPSVQVEGKLLVVPAGSLDDEVPLRPDAHLFNASRADWDSGLEKVPLFDRLPE
ncbi:MAG: GFA family protein [Sedimenticola sp.]|nr:GFA family protein [Sedimenticola sp.]